MDTQQQQPSRLEAEKSVKNIKSKLSQIDPRWFSIPIEVMEQRIHTDISDNDYKGKLDMIDELYTKT